MSEMQQQHAPPSGLPGGGPLPDDLEDLREQDRYLPIANVARIMKRALPENAKIAKDAKECVQECVSEFISFVTSEAADRCQAERRKTVNGEDILYALQALGFDNYCEVLKVYLSKYRETLKTERIDAHATNLRHPARADLNLQLQQYYAHAAATTGAVPVQLPNGSMVLMPVDHQGYLQHPQAQDGANAATAPPTQEEIAAAQQQYYQQYQQHIEAAQRQMLNEQTNEQEKGSEDQQ